MGTNSETKSSFDISLFLKRFHNSRHSFSIYKRFNQRQKETEIGINVLDATLVVYLNKEQPEIVRFIRPSPITAQCYLSKSLKILENLLVLLCFKGIWISNIRL